MTRHGRERSLASIKEEPMHLFKRFNTVMRALHVQRDRRGF